MAPPGGAAGAEAGGAGAPQFAEPSAGAGRGETAALAPNMIGNLLRSNNSVSYFINRALGGTEVNSFGAGRVQNAAVAENNSPEPRDRLSFRYNYFNNAQSVTGLSSTPPVYRPDLGLGVFTQATQTQNYDVNLYNLSFEKTFLDGLLSVETRMAVLSGLAPKLNLRETDNPGAPTPAQRNTPDGKLIGFYNPTTNAVVAVPQGMNPPPGFTQPVLGFSVNANANNALTRGNYGNQFDNMSLFLKGVLYKTPELLVSGGLGVNIPTGADTHVQVTDYLGGATTIFAEIQRVRDFTIKNETWTLSPFLAALATPTKNLFAQGFLEVECPLNGSTYNFNETFPIAGTRNPANPPLGYFPVSQTGRINDQTLLHVDIGTGYWLFRNPDRRWFNGMAPTVELHYVTTLDNADIVTLPGDGSKARIGGNATAVAPGPEIGNLNNRVDILDLTLGTTFLFGNRTTLATAFVVPLKRSTDRTFDYEFQVQLNIFFGGPGRLGRGTPNF
jgi:hypothetical protein